MGVMLLGSKYRPRYGEGMEDRHQNHPQGQFRPGLVETLMGISKETLTETSYGQ